jgi:hypothetical protein
VAGGAILVVTLGLVVLIADHEEPLPRTCAGINAERDQILERNTMTDPMTGFQVAKLPKDWRAGDWERNQRLIQAATDEHNESGDAWCSLRWVPTNG